MLIAFYKLFTLTIAVLPVTLCSSLVIKLLKSLKSFHDGWTTNTGISEDVIIGECGNERDVLVYPGELDAYTLLPEPLDDSAILLYLNKEFTIYSKTFN